MRLANACCRWCPPKSFSCLRQAWQITNWPSLDALENNSEQAIRSTDRRLIAPFRPLSILSFFEYGANLCNISKKTPNFLSFSFFFLYRSMRRRHLEGFFKFKYFFLFFVSFQITSIFRSTSLNMVSSRKIRNVNIFETRLPILFCTRNCHKRSVKLIQIVRE